MAEGDVTALPCEQDDDSATNAGIAASDDGRHAIELARPFPERRIVHRRGIQSGLVSGLGLVLLRKGRLGIAPRPGLHGPVVLVV